MCSIPLLLDAGPVLLRMMQSQQQRSSCVRSRRILIASLGPAS